MGYQLMLSPGKIGTMKVKNRIFLPPMGMGFCDEHSFVTDRLIKYHSRIAKGGCALNIVEVTTVHPSSLNAFETALYDDKFIDGHRRLTDAIHENGGKCGIELYHGGWLCDNDECWIPSETTLPKGKTAHILSIEEIHELVESFGDAAVRAQKAGYDAIWIHGGHGYLIDLFANPHTNKRTDEYGGDITHRARFGVEVIKNIRKKVGPNMPVVMRFCAQSFTDGDNTLADGKQLAMLYEAAGVDALDVSQGADHTNNDSIEDSLPPYYLPHGFFTKSGLAIKSVVKVPVIIAGFVTVPELAEKILKTGAADFVSVGRQQLSDPDFVKKTEEDRVGDIVHCIGCTQGCMNRRMLNLPATCIFRPETGNEEPLSRVATPKKVLVIGAGPAGLEAARIAAERGHKVTIMEKSGLVGGQYYLAGFAPKKQQIIANCLQMALRAQKAGVDIRLYTMATAERIKAFAPDHVIVATGGHPAVPPIPGVEKTKGSWDIIAGKAFIKGNNVVVIGGGLVGMEAMEILSAQGKQVTIVEMANMIGKDLELIVWSHYKRVLDDGKVNVRVNTKCLEIKDNEIIVETDGKRQTIPCDGVVLAAGVVSDKVVPQMVDNLGIPYSVIGDAKNTGKVLRAIKNGNEIARAIN